MHDNAGSDWDGDRDSDLDLDCCSYTQRSPVQWCRSSIVNWTEATSATLNFALHSQSHADVVDAGFLGKLRWFIMLPLMWATCVAHLPAANKVLDGPLGWLTASLPGCPTLPLASHPQVKSDRRSKDARAVKWNPIERVFDCFPTM